MSEAPDEGIVLSDDEIADLISVQAIRPERRRSQLRSWEDISPEIEAGWLKEQTTCGAVLTQPVIDFGSSSRSFRVSLRMFMEAKRYNTRQISPANDERLDGMVVFRLIPVPVPAAVERIMQAKALKNSQPKAIE
jgi:hypothetical protein